MKSKCCKKNTFLDQYNNLRCEQCFIPIIQRKPLRMVYIALFMVILCGFTLKSSDSRNNMFKYIISSKDTCDIPLNRDSIFKELENDSCYFPSVAILQYEKETNFGKSELVQTNNNLFGLKCSCRLCKGFRNGHSYYKSRKDCILCYTHFMNSYWKKYCNNYAEDKFYLKNLIKQK